MMIKLINTSMLIVINIALRKFLMENLYNFKQILHRNKVKKTFIKQRVSMFLKQRVLMKSI